MAVLLAVAVLHVSMAAVVPFVLVTVLAALCFSLLAYALRLAMGWVGVGIFLLFLWSRWRHSATCVPLETAPAALQAVNGLLPLTAYVNGASQLVSGGDVGSTFATVLVLAGLGSGGLRGNGQPGQASSDAAPGPGPAAGVGSAA